MLCFGSFGWKGIEVSRMMSWISCRVERLSASSWALISTIFRNSSFFYSLRLEYSSLLASLFLYFLFLSFFV